VIKYKEGLNTYRTCDFQPSSNDGMNTYGPSSIRAYGLKNDKCYESREVSLQGDSTQKVFMEVIVRGNVTLFNYQGRFFIEKTGGSLQHLKNGVKETVIDGKSMQRATNEYAGILSMTLTECATIRPRIHQTRLREKQLTELIDDYNRCVDNSSTIYKSSRPWAKFAPGLIAGINLSEVKFQTWDVSKHLNEPFSKYTSPVIGFSLDLLFPRTTEHISGHAELLYLASKYNSFHEEGPNSMHTSTNRYYVSVEFHQLKIPVGIRYAFKGKQFLPYVNVGFSTTRNFGVKVRQKEETEYQGVVTEYHRPPFQFRSDQWGYWAGIGGTHRTSAKYSLFAELRYEGTKGITPRAHYHKRIVKSSVTNISFLIGIRLN
jgi:hypothetical protein